MNRREAIAGIACITAAVAVRVPADAELPRS